MMNFPTWPCNYVVKEEQKSPVADNDMFSNKAYKKISNLNSLNSVSFKIISSAIQQEQFPKDLLIQSLDKYIQKISNESFFTAKDFVANDGDEVF